MRNYIFPGLTALSLIATSCVQHRYSDVVDETYLHKYGVEVPADYWTESGQHGAVISTRNDGVVVTKSYTAGILDGETTYTYPHSDKIQKKEMYDQAKLVKELDYFHDGTPQHEIVYTLPTQMREVTFWYTTGAPKSHEWYDGDSLLSGEYYNSTNQRDSFVDNYEGTRVNRDDYGQLISQDTIQRGQLVLSTTFHSNGSPKEMIPYQNGVVEGYKRTFHPGGEPNTLEQWSRGLQNGITIVYQNGEKYAEVPYVNGNKSGVERQYKDGTIVVKEISWDKDNMHGPSKTYVGNTISKVDWYFRGKPTTKVDFESLTTIR